MRSQRSASHLVSQLCHISRYTLADALALDALLEAAVALVDGLGHDGLLRLVLLHHALLELVGVLALACAASR